MRGNALEATVRTAWGDIRSRTILPWRVIDLQTQPEFRAASAAQVSMRTFAHAGIARGRTFLDRELYLPEAWAGDIARRVAAGVPEGVKFAIKPQLARRMIAGALDVGVACAWVTGDSVYGTDSKLREWLEEREQPYVLGVTAQYRLFTERGREWAQDVVKQLPARSWHRLSCGSGRKGERLYNWTRVQARTIERQRRRWLVARHITLAMPDMPISRSCAPWQPTLTRKKREAPEKEEDRARDGGRTDPADGAGGSPAVVVVSVAQAPDR